MKYSLFENESGQNVTVLIDDNLYTASNEHPNFNKILEKVRALDSEGLKELFDPAVAAEVKFAELSDRISVRNGIVYYNGDPVDNSLTRQIFNFLKNEEEDWRPLVAFYDRLMTNLDEHTRNELYRWLSDRDFEITGDGKFLAYKGLLSDLTSVHSGPAVVDGQPLDGHIPNKPGSVITMARSQVQNDSSVGCSTGLHAGTWGYASTFGSVVVKVLIDPADVVSVPTDCNDEKLRVCRYKVLEVVEQKSDSLVDHRWGDDAYDEYYDSGYDEYSYDEYF